MRTLQASRHLGRFLASTTISPQHVGVISCRVVQIASILPRLPVSVVKVMSKTLFGRQQCRELQFNGSRSGRVRPATFAASAFAFASGHSQLFDVACSTSHLLCFISRIQIVRTSLCMHPICCQSTQPQRQICEFRGIPCRSRHWRCSSGSCWC